jgi:ribosomal protein S12 methylthiotransferase accessory factor
VLIERPAFSPRFRVEVAPQGIYLLSEHDRLLLGAPIYKSLAPLLDGSRTVDEIVDAMERMASPAEVYYALDCLERQRLIVEPAGLAPARAAFWEEQGCPARDAEERLAKASVAMRAAGDIAVAPFAEAAAQVPLRVVEEGMLTIVVADDFLQSSLAAINDNALSSGRPWLLVAPLGTTPAIGPLFEPGVTACWECLADRLRMNRELDMYLERRRSGEATAPATRAALPATIAAVAYLTAIEAARILTAPASAATRSTIVTMDFPSMATRKHAVVRRPQCRRCGEPRAYEAGPIVPASQRRLPGADGGHRVVTPEETLARFEHHISPLSGAVKSLTRVGGGDPQPHVYRATHSFGDGGAAAVSRIGRGNSSGKGTTDAQARASALCEALERYSGIARGDEARRRATYQDLGDEAVHPGACMLYSAAQYERRDVINARGSRFNRVPVPFDERAAIEWTPLWSLTRSAVRWLPTSYCYYGISVPAEARFCWADSNGCAAGNTLEEAILQGLMELVERDAVAIWWYNRLRRPAAPDPSDEPYIHAIRKRYESLGRTLWFLDLTSDLGVPAVTAVSADHAGGRVVLGFGAHLDARVALLRAATELNQMFVVITGRARGGDPLFNDPDARDWWSNATVANQPHLLPDEAAPRGRFDPPLPVSNDLGDDILACRRVLESKGLELLVLDQTRPDIGLPVVRVVVPGLRHFWSRLAAGRLYDVPVRMGCLNAPRSEEQLNPIPMFY